MNGAEGPFLTGWPAQRDMYQATTPIMPPVSPSTHPGSTGVVDPRFYQLFPGGVSREPTNSSRPTQHAPQQQQLPMGAISPSIIPTSLSKPVNQYDGRKQMISYSAKDMDISKHRDTSNNAPCSGDYSYTSGTPKPLMTSEDDYLTAAHNAMLEKSGLYKQPRQLSSPFTHMQSNQFRPIRSPYPQEMLNGYPASPTRSVTPQTHQNISSPAFRSPVDDRQENQIQTNYSGAPPARPADFWSQFGLLPPNSLTGSKNENQSRKPSQSLPTAHSDNQNAIDTSSEKLMPKPKTTKVRKQKSASSDPQNQQQSFMSNTEGQTVERKKDIKYSRKKKIDDPSIKELVDAKVQEIMAACRQNEIGQTKVSETQQSSSGNISNETTKFGSDTKQTSDQFYKNTTSSRMPAAFGTETENLQNKFIENKNGKSVQPSYQTSSPFSHSQGQHMNYNAPEHNSQVTLHYKPTSSFPQDLRYLSEQVAEVRTVRKESRSPCNMEANSVGNPIYPPHPAQNMNPSYSSGNKDPNYNQVLSLTEHISDVRNMRKERRSPLNADTAPQGNVKLPYVPDVEKRQDSSYVSPQLHDGNGSIDHGKSVNSGRISPCCGDCGKLGIRYSENCQSRKKSQNISDPYSFNAFEEQHEQLLKEYKLGKFRQTTEKKSKGVSSDQNSSKFQDPKMSLNEQKEATKVYHDAGPGMVDSRGNAVPRKFDPQVIDLKSESKGTDKSRQHNFSDDLSSKTKHHLSYLSDSSSKSYNLSKFDSVSSSSVSSSVQSAAVTSLPKFSSTWGHGEWPQRQCASVQERSRLPSTVAPNLNNVKPGPVKVKRGRKPKLDKANSLPVSSLPHGSFTNTFKENGAKFSNVENSAVAKSMSLESNVGKSVENIDPFSSFEDAQVINSMKQSLEDSVEVAGEGSRLPEDSGIGLEIDDDKLTPLPDGVSPEKVSQIKDKIESLKSMVTGEEEVHERLATNRVIEVPKCACLGENGRLYTCRFMSINFVIFTVNIQILEVNGYIFEEATLLF